MGQIFKAAMMFVALTAGAPIARIIVRPAVTLFRSFVSYAGPTGPF